MSPGVQINHWDRSIHSINCDWGRVNSIYSARHTLDIHFANSVFGICNLSLSLVFQYLFDTWYSEMRVTSNFNNFNIPFPSSKLCLDLKLNLIFKDNLSFSDLQQKLKFYAFTEHRHDIDTNAFNSRLKKMWMNFHNIRTLSASTDENVSAKALRRESREWKNWVGKAQHSLFSRSEDEKPEKPSFLDFQAVVL